MIRKWLSWGSVGSVLLLMTSTECAESADYPAMASPGLYMMDRAAEIALARSAAPSSISDAAGVMVLGAHGFETAANGKNGFVCIVERAWDKGFGDPEFWNPKMRGPVCMNEPAVRTVLPIFLERAQWALAGVSKAQMEAKSATSNVAKMTPAAGAMSFMMAKGQYLSDDGGHWYPHVMFFSPHVEPGAWGANLKGSPVLADPTSGPFTLFFVPVRKWSDGTLVDYGPPAGSSDHHH
jgi:hypothetical protein